MTKHPTIEAAENDKTAAGTMSLAAETQKPTVTKAKSETADLEARVAKLEKLVSFLSSIYGWPDSEPPAKAGPPVAEAPPEPPETA